MFLMMEEYGAPREVPVMAKYRGDCLRHALAFGSGAKHFAS
jgi:hypothetical protein